MFPSFLCQFLIDHRDTKNIKGSQRKPKKFSLCFLCVLRVSVVKSGNFKLVESPISGAENAVYVKLDFPGTMFASISSNNFSVSRKIHKSEIALHGLPVISLKFSHLTLPKIRRRHVERFFFTIRWGERAAKIHFLQPCTNE